MCGRYTMALEIQLVREEIEAELDASMQQFDPSYNVAPTQQAPICIQNSPRRLTLMRWGVSRFSRQIINVRRETLLEKNTFAREFESQRCLVPAGGYYEWQKSSGQRIPYYFYRNDQQIMWFAGLWFEGEVSPSFAIVTTEATAGIDRIHDRMPLIFSRDEALTWVDNAGTPQAAATRLLSGKCCSLSWHRVATMVNSVASNGPECIAPDDSPEQMELF